jgi:hypothetical protein
MTTKKVLEDLTSLFEGATDANIEDYLSELVDLLAVTERRVSRGATKNQVDLNGQTYNANQLREAVDEIKRAIAEIIDSDITIDTHQQFVRAIHQPTRPGKLNQNPPVDYLVLNYDTLLEDALAIEKITMADGLDGGVTGWWNPSTFHRNGLEARILKIHGSIDWCEFPDDPLPRRVANKLNVHPIKERRILIWPASTKYRETQRDPYAQLIELARQILRPTFRTVRILIIAGYHYGDTHINFEIDRALRESEGRLTVVAFSSDDHPTGQLKIWNEDVVVREQVLIFANRGFFHGDRVENSTIDLPWWKFENITRLLGGER